MTTHATPKVKAAALGVQVAPSNSANRVLKPDVKETTLESRRNYFLERIAMQQDCVDDEEEDFLLSLHSVQKERKDLIRSRIAHQMDIPGEQFKK